MGVGAVIGQYGIAHDFGWGWDVDDTEWDATWAVRPFFALVMSRIGGSWAAEVSYAFGGDLSFTPETFGGCSRVVCRRVLRISVLK